MATWCTEGILKTSSDYVYCATRHAGMRCCRNRRLGGENVAFRPRQMSMNSEVLQNVYIAPYLFQEILKFRCLSSVSFKCFFSGPAGKVPSLGTHS